MDLVEQSSLLKSIVSELLKNSNSITTTDNIINMTIGKPVSTSHVKKLNLSESSITFQEVDRFWIENLMFGALDYYKNDDIKALQVLPADKNLLFSTIPNMSLPLDKSKSSIWIDYFKEGEDINCINNDYWWVDTGILHGKPILEIYHIEDDEWQALSYHSGETRNDNQMFQISFHTIVTIDSDTVNILDLETGNWSRRDSIRERW